MNIATTLTRDNADGVDQLIWVAAKSEDAVEAHDKTVDITKTTLTSIGDNMRGLAARIDKLESGIYT